MRGKTGVLSIAVLVCIFLILVPATPAEAREDAYSGVTKDQWKEDLRYLSRELQKRHKNLFHTVSREEFERAIADLETAIPTLSGEQIIVRMGQVVAMVGDGHTRLHVPASFRRYPLVLFWFGPELRVTATTKEYERALGARVVKIGGMGIDEVQSRVSKCFPSAENENPWFVMNTSPAFIALPEVLHALAVVHDLDRAPFTFRDDQGQEFSLDLAPVLQDGSLKDRLLWAAASEPLSRQRRNERFWYVYLPEARTVYVNFRGYDSLGSQAKDLYKFIDDHQTDRLVIDMRQNGGGDFLQGRKHLVEPLKERTGLNQPGKVFVAIGRQTFSAAMVNAIDFRKETNAMLVGEPAGERPNSYSENDEMTLPNSRIVVSYSTRYYKFLEEDAPAVMPDHLIDPTWEAYKAGRDPVMEWILAYPAAPAAK